MMSDTAEPIDDHSTMGRPSTFDIEQAERICTLMAEGKGLREVCSLPGMPGRTTVQRWLEANADFRDQYARARIHLMDWYAEEILKIAFDESGDMIIDGERAASNHAKVQRDKLKIDTLKWIMSKLAPRRYGVNSEDLAPADRYPINKIELVGVAAPVTFAWEKIERVIVDPKNPDAEHPQEPRQITYTPPAPEGLTPEAWRMMLDVLNLIEANTPQGSDETPERVLAAIRDALIALPADTFSASTENKSDS